MTVTPHIKIVFRGSLKDTPEEWSISLKYRKTVSGSPNPELGDIHSDGIHDAASAFFGNGRFNAGLLWEEWRAYDIGADGLMVGNPRVELLEATDFVQGAYGGAVWPPQCAICVTSVGVNRGPARFGRFFLPCIVGPLDADFRLSAAIAQGYADAASTFVKSVSGAIDVPDTLQNVPLINVSNINAGIQEVDHLSVGRVIDTQRRRRNQLLEDAVVTGHIDW